MARRGLPPINYPNAGYVWIPGIGYQRTVHAPPVRRRTPTRHAHHRPLGEQPEFRMPWSDDRQRA